MGLNLGVILCNGYLQMDGTFIGCFYFGFDYLLVASCQCPSLAKHPWSQNLQDVSKTIVLVKIPNQNGIGMKHYNLEDVLIWLS
jgi:hypothetical protein